MRRATYLLIATGGGILASSIVLKIPENAIDPVFSNAPNHGQVIVASNVKSIKLDSDTYICEKWQISFLAAVKLYGLSGFKKYLDPKFMYSDSNVLFGHFPNIRYPKNSKFGVNRIQSIGSEACERSQSRNIYIDGRVVMLTPEDTIVTSMILRKDRSIIAASTAHKITHEDLAYRGTIESGGSKVESIVGQSIKKISSIIGKRINI